MALLQRLSFWVLFIALSGCGGSGDGGLSNTSTTTDPVDVYTVTLSISDANVTPQLPATVSALVILNDVPSSGELVTFSTSLGSFSPEVGTALTNAEGIATIVINAGDIAGAGQVQGSISSGEEGNVGFTTQGASIIVLRLGAGSPFTEGALELSLEQISAGGTSVITVNIVDEQGVLFTESAEVIFNSVCANETEPSAEVDSPVLTSNGIATSTYFAKGCVGDDPITANVVVGDQNLSANGTINVLSADVGSIEFVSTSPSHIAIQGVGSEQRPESSTVIFKVLNTNGNPVNNQNVSFSLGSDSGDVELNPTNATTNNEGLVQTVVNSGTVSRTIRVVASVDDSDPLISTQSSLLKISTGIPDQDSMSISADILNPEGWDIDGTEVVITARLADASNNPPPPTTVYFTTEGGSIENLENSCVTGDDGSCFVTWRSQSPKPEGHTLQHKTDQEYIYSENPDVVHSPEIQNSLGQKYGGRVTILATTIGEESFPDLNGNGRFDVCEVPAFVGGTGKPCLADGSFDESKADIVYSGNDVGGNPYDLAEAYSDYNEDGFFNPSEEDPAEELGGELEEPVDFDNNGLFDTKDGKYNGVLCALTTHDGCSEQKSIDVRDSIVLTMSGSFAQFVTTLPIGGADISIVGEGTANASVIISDLHNQPMPAESIVEFSVAGFGSIDSGPSFSWSNHNKNGGTKFSVTIKGEKEDLPKTGTLWVTVTTPSGTGTSYPVANILIQ
ncbi:MAG: hypothetical protein ACI9YH_000875 [Colwellia sp.]|jgi:hypothetical protein